VSKPYIHFPDANPQEGEQHRTVTIRHNNATIRLKCKDRASANAMGKTIVAVINRYMNSSNKITIKHQ
jgi:hypothetical protein